MHPDKKKNRDNEKIHCVFLSLALKTNAHISRIKMFRHKMLLLILLWSTEAARINNDIVPWSRFKETICFPYAKYLSYLLGLLKKNPHIVHKY